MRTWNGARLLDAQIASVLARQGVRFASLIGGDASTDCTWPMLQDRAARSNCIRIFHHEHRLGLHANFASVLSNCQADFIAPCDQDDLRHPQKPMRLHAALQSGGHALADCDPRLVDESGRHLALNMSDRFTLGEGSAALPLCFRNGISSHAMLFRRRLLDIAPAFPAGFLPDCWLAICAADSGSIAYLAEPQVGYRQHQASQTDVAQRRRALRDSWRIKDERAARLSAMAQLAGSDQPCLQQLSRLWAQRANDHLCWQLVRRKTQRRYALMRLNRRCNFARFALQLLAGQRWRARRQTSPT